MTQPDSPLPLRNIRRIIHNKIKDSRTSFYVDAAQVKKWKVLLDKNNKIPSSLPRAVGVACSRMTTGHDYLQKHLCRIGEKDSACCPLCHHGDMDCDHLKNCPEILKIVSGKFIEAKKDFFPDFTNYHHFIGLLVI